MKKRKKKLRAIQELLTLEHLSSLGWAAAPVGALFVVRMISPR